MALHEDALGTLDQSAAPEGALEVLILREASEHDVDRALPVLDISIADVGKDASLGRFADEPRVPCVEQDNHGAGGFLDDLVDQVESVF